MPIASFTTALGEGSSLWPAALVLLKATAILIAGLGITIALHRSSASTRHLVWLVALGGLLALPAIATLSPVDVPVLPAPAAAAIDPGTTPGTVDPPATPNPTGEVTLPATTRDAAPATAVDASWLSRVSLSGLLLGVWALVALVLLGRLLHGVIAVRRIVRHAAPIDDSTWQDPLHEIADRLGLDDVPELLRSDRIHMPFAAGFRRAIVVLPTASEGWTTAQREAVLVHELGHVRRRDIAGHMLGRVACAIYWFHPLVWTAARRLRDASERACDDLAIRLGATPSEYAQHLLDIVTKVRHPGTPTAAIAMARRKEFEGRMLAILDPALRRTESSRWRTVALSTGLAVLVVAISAAVPAPRSATTLPVMAADGSETFPEVAPADDPESSPIATPATRDGVQRDRERARETRRVDEDADAVVAQVNVMLGVDVRETMDPDKLDILIGILSNDSSADVRRVAAWGLQRYIGEARARTALASALGTDADAEVRAMAGWALAQAKTADVLPPLRRALTTDQSADVREVAAWGLGNLGDDASATALGERLATETSSDVRSAAAWALGQIAPPSAPRALVALLEDPDADVRLPAAWALSNIGDSSALPAIRRALDREQEEMVTRALLRAMVRSGATPESLSQFLSSANPTVRMAAVRSISGAGGVDPWPWPWPRPIPMP